MNIWNKAPLIRLLLPFLTGIIFAVYCPVPYHYQIFLTVALSAMILLVFFILKPNSSHSNSHWFGVLTNIVFFILAYQVTVLKTEKFSSNHFSKFVDSSNYYYARIKDPFLEKDRSLKVIAEVLAVKHNNDWESTSGKALIYFKKEERSLKLEYGDEILIKADFKEVPAPQNPGEFNYKNFMAYHNIFDQAYLKSSDWVYSGKNSGNPILRYCINLRNRLLNVLTENHLKNDEFSVGAALLLGYSDKLDANIIQAYASTGALHVLSVSGLHVAIVYFVFSWLLFFFDKMKHGLIIKSILLLLFLWFYAALTGLSPSVLRAATMFSFIILAKTYDRHTNIYNTLAASAFFLLLINPYLIMDVGFQLSYLAVVGILYIQPKIYAWFKIENWMLNQIWMLTSVSIAAQIATFPLGLYYFHQFPNYFLLSNFIVIPVSTIIIYLGISVFVFAKIPLLVKYLAIGFNWSVWFLNASVKNIETWPYAVLQGISTTVFETWMLYGSIILFFYYFAKRKSKYLYYALSMTIILLCLQVNEQYNEYRQKKLIVYNIPKTSAIDFISAKANVLLTDPIFAKNKSALLFHVKHNWWDLGINDNRIISDSIQTSELKINNNSVQFYDKRIVILNEKKMIYNAVMPMEVDYLIVSKNLTMKISDIEKLFRSKVIVFDSSNSAYRIKKWKEECTELNQAYYSVVDSGALVLDM